jgi:hypothetical protein
MLIANRRGVKKSWLPPLAGEQPQTVFPCPNFYGEAGPPK